jgi:iron complex outermembrane receptor protein
MRVSISAALFCSRVAIAAALVPVPVMAQAQAQEAQQSTTSADDTIVVTAQRRAETVQDVPLAISAVGGENLRGRNVSDLTALSGTLSNVDINVANGVPRITIRGIGNTSTQPNSESQLAYHVDGFYVGRPEATSDSFFDVKRIEVVRGPQGTLYGRNATSGAINVITGDPTDTLDGYGDLTLGTFQMVKFEGALSGPLAPGISARVAVQTIDHSGYGKDGQGRDLQDQHSRAIRGKLKLEPTSGLEILLSADYYHQDDASSAVFFANAGDYPGLVNRGFLFGGTVPSDRYHNNSGNRPTRLQKDDWGVGATINWELGDHATLTSLTGYRKTDFSHAFDFDLTEIDLAFYKQTAQAKQFSQELRVGGKVGRVNYVIGGYYYQDELHFRGALVRNRTNFDPSLSSQLIKSFNQDGLAKTQAYAIFGQVGIDVTDWIGVDLGGRQSWERKNRVYDGLASLQPPSLPFPSDPTSPSYAILINPAGFYDDRLDIFDPANIPTLSQFGHIKPMYKKFTPKATVRITPMSDVMLYATYSQGFRSGGFALGTGSSYEPEVLDNYEAGLKAQWFDRRLTTNISVFHYSYTDLQVTKVNPLGGANIVESAGKATVDGAEIELILKPGGGFQFDGNVGYVDGKYKDFSSTDSQRPGLGVIDLAGKRLPQASKWMINAGAQYTMPGLEGSFTARGEVSYRSKLYFTPFNTDAFAQDGYALFNTYLNYENDGGRLYGGVFVKNIGNKHYWVAKHGAPVSLGAFVYGQSAAPRTAGLRIGYRL